MTELDSLRTLDLFCGGGGSSVGARAAGAKVVAGVDAWDLATLTFGANFPGAKPVNARLHRGFDPTAILEQGSVDLILASPECTNHTCAKGSAARDEESKATATYLARFAKALQPRWLVLENVVHMRSWHGFHPLTAALRALGYKLSTQILDAADFGVPQARRRLFILCDREALPPVVRPTRHPRKTVDRDVVLWDQPWKSRPLERPGRALDTLARADRAISELGRGVPFLIVYYGSDGSGGWQPLDRPLRTVTTLDRFGLVTWSGRKPMLRMLQVPELQRAMGLPRDFQLPFGTRRDRIRLLGNGVCPPVMEAIVRTLTRTPSVATHTPLHARALHPAQAAV